MRTKALLTSSPVLSLPDSLGLTGGVLDGLLAIVGAVDVAVVVVVLIVVLCGSVVYSRYLIWSNEYGARTDGGKPGAKRSGDGGSGIVPDEEGIG